MSNGTPINEVGNVYGKLTVRCRSSQTSKHEGLFWECQCVCGNLRDALGVSLRRSYGPRACVSCTVKPSGRKNVKNEIGSTYGWLEVKARAFPQTGNRAEWWCRCRCGDWRKVDGVTLRRSNAKTCGCRAKPLIDLAA